MAFDTSPNGSGTGANAAGGYWHSGTVDLLNIKSVNQDIFSIKKYFFFYAHILMLIFF